MSALATKLAIASRDYRPERVIIALLPLAFGVLVALKVAGAFELSTGALIVIGVRLVVPLLIFRFWLVGGIIAMLTDLVDVILIDLISLGGFGGEYAQIDKVLDSYYYVLELVVALKWENPWTRLPAVALFVYRIIGAGLYEATETRIFLFFFPNLFENWWLFCVVAMKWWPHLVPKTAKGMVTAMVLLLLPKIPQEYLLHVAEAHPWGWTKEHILAPIGLKP
ncbi:MAG: hypothetical protein ACKVVT_13395 [Dehalococcoidia bacterium]